MTPTTATLTDLQAAIGSHVPLCRDNAAQARIHGIVTRFVVKVEEVTVYEGDSAEMAANAYNEGVEKYNQHQTK